jgi:predicted nucleic acid-binding protein
MIFLDASAAVKAYVSEPGSPTVHATLARRRGRLVLSRLVVVEVLATLAKRQRAGMLSKQAYQRLREQFIRDVLSFCVIVQPPDEVFDDASSLVNRHHSFAVGGADVVHVASALTLQAKAGRNGVTMVSSDRGLLMLARAVGLNTFDPETQPLAALLAAG